LTAINTAYNAKKKRAIKGRVIEIASIDVGRAKAADIAFDSLCFDAVNAQTSSPTGNALYSGRQSTAVKIKVAMPHIALKGRRIEVPSCSGEPPPQEEGWISI